MLNKLWTKAKRKNFSTTKKQKSTSAIIASWETEVAINDRIRQDQLRKRKKNRKNVEWAIFYQKLLVWY